MGVRFGIVSNSRSHFLRHSPSIHTHHPFACYARSLCVILHLVRKEILAKADAEARYVHDTWTCAYPGLVSIDYVPAVKRVESVYFSTWEPQSVASPRLVLSVLFREPQCVASSWFAGVCLGAAEHRVVSSRSVSARFVSAGAHS